VTALLAPSILSADFGRLAEQVREVQEGGAGLIHVDVMDGRFVPNITVGPAVTAAVRKATTLPVDCHLMIEEPERHVEAFARAGASMISVHVEAARHLHRTVQAIRDLGAEAGVVLNPATPLSSLDEILQFADFVLIMSVNPGFGGQSFIPSSLRKIRELRERIRAGGWRARIEVDGGVTLDNVDEVVAAGGELIVAGNAVFAGGNPREKARRMAARLAALAEHGAGR
jgi:ribulose-phosphate 3-epimerase